MKTYLSAAVALLTFFSSVQAEVVDVLITWSPGLCQQTCGQGLQRYLSEIPGVAQVDINLTSGSAKMRWKPNQPFNFSYIDHATRVVGLPRILNSRIKVRGTIQRSGDTFNLISLGDNTSFLLLGTTQPTPGRYEIQTSLYNRPLSEAIKNRLLESQRQHQVVTIDGQLFEPVRQINPVIIVENITVEKKEKMPGE